MHEDMEGFHISNLDGLDTLVLLYRGRSRETKVDP